MTISPALDAVFAAMDMEVDAFALCTIAADTCLATPPVAVVEVHYVLAGTLHIAVGDAPPRALGPGVVVLVPAGMRQRLAGSGAPRVTVKAEAVCAAGPDGLLSFEAGVGDGVRLVCGKVRAALGGGPGPLEGLAAPIVADLADDDFVRTAFATMLRETAAPGPGTRTLAGALMKACFVLLLRRHLVQHETAALPGWLGRVPLGRAVASVLDDPARDHRVAALARTAGMSRSAFARLFAERVGMPPMAFVAQTRLARARLLLDGSVLSVDEVATRVGFASRSAFSRSFRRRYGIDPKGFRARISEDATDVR